jgi:hypothetical protein
MDGEYVPRSWDQTHAGKFLVGFQRQDLWSVSLGGTLRRGWPLTSVAAEEEMDDQGEIGYVAVPVDRNADRYPDYWRADFQARRAFPVPRGRLWLTLDVTNLTDRENACCVNDFHFSSRPDGRVGVRPTFDSWLGRTGSFSLLWEFGGAR